VRRIGCNVAVTVAVEVASSVGVGVADGLGVALAGWGVSVDVSVGADVETGAGASAACLHPPSNRPIDTSIVKTNREFIATFKQVLQLISCISLLIEVPRTFFAQKMTFQQGAWHFCKISNGASEGDCHLAN